MITHERIDQLEKDAIKNFQTTAFIHSSEEKIAKEGLEITLEILALARMGLGIKLSSTNIVKHH